MCTKRTRSGLLTDNKRLQPSKGQCLQPQSPATLMINPNQLTQQELQAWDRCKEVGEDFTRLSQAEQLILTRLESKKGKDSLSLA